MQTKNSVECKNVGNKQTNEFPLLKQLFTRHQILCLQRKRHKRSTKFQKWANGTITESLKLKFGRGNNGHLELLRQGYPLPSVRTLQRRLENSKI